MGSAKCRVSDDPLGLGRAASVEEPSDEMEGIGVKPDGKKYRDKGEKAELDVESRRLAASGGNAGQYQPEWTGEPDREKSDSYQKGFMDVESGAPVVLDHWFRPVAEIQPDVKGKS